MFLFSFYVSKTYLIQLGGSSVIPIMSVAYSFSVELTYPMSEVLTNGMMISATLIWGTLQGILDGVLAEIEPRYAMLTWVVTSFLAILVALTIKCK